MLSIRKEASFISYVQPGWLKVRDGAVPTLASRHPWVLHLRSRPVRIWMLVMLVVLSFAAFFIPYEVPTCPVTRVLHSRRLTAVVYEPTRSPLPMTALELAS